MFNNTLALGSATTGGSSISVALIDGPTNRRTIRAAEAAEGSYEFTIGHQSSNENPGFDTQRSVVRLSVTKRDTETGKEFTAYAQMVLGIPRDVFDATDSAVLVAQLISFFVLNGDPDRDFAVLFGENSSTGDMKQLVLESVTRLHAGEP